MTTPRPFDSSPPIAAPAIAAPNLMFPRFLEDQHAASREITQRGELVRIAWPSEQHARVELDCTGLVRRPDGRIVEHASFAFDVFFRESHLRYVNSLSLITLLAPMTHWHANTNALGGVCIGRVAPGTELLEIVYRLFDLVTCNSMTVDERDALNHDACRWARGRMECFPIDGRGLFWHRGDAIPEVPGAGIDWGTA